ncbi:MerR family transcriptional regulator [Aeromicrobium sp. SMF47]|uniref:MerR family transcriptional regulator n=1 Tax=Aeromicrobium yanjiei TaxID=2662028 RepID=A0A5Q2MI14_9ACTN|nr:MULTISPECIES: MerR family transcriptional regulator [Aeromicrobium]MRJ78235.1 MerR family transcriptional regulator [Aeromicrobium yanjiei]MRK03135.1 MerR family transcriptional regulator [Aeromicrobium sp. S22]QGG40702.1 MerR family transcriptional regulator [Aeromicrobium yanjiei]
MADDAGTGEELTIDELAARAQMTVRNVRAYAARGLIDAPRLAGRTGYYNREHLQRLQLVRQLLERGFTLAAIEKAIQNTPHHAAGHTLDLMTILDLPDEGDAEIMSREDLAALAGVERDDALIESMVGLGLVEKLDGDRVRLMEPAVVRAGAAAVTLGLPPESVISLFPVLQSHLRTIADTFVREVVTELIQPFIDAGLPEHDWRRIIDLVDGLLPIASQVTLGIFRSEIRKSIDIEVGEQITGIAAKLD